MSNASANTTSSGWIQSRLSSLYDSEAKSEPDAGFHSTFDRTFSPACEVRVNHAMRPLQAFKDDLASRRVTATHSSVAWNTDSVISTNEDEPGELAVVAGAFVVTRSLPFRIRASPAQTLTHVHFSARVEQDAHAQAGDRRRIASFYCTSVDKTPPIHLAVPRESEDVQ